MVENVAQNLQGMWLAISSDNIDNYLTALGVGKCERQSTAKKKIWQKIKVTDDVIHLEMSCSGSRYIKLQFRLNETFEIRAGKCSKARASWRDDALVIECARVDSGLTQIIERRLVGEHMVQIAVAVVYSVDQKQTAQKKMSHKDVTCSRTFVRSSDTDLE